MPERLRAILGPDANTRIIIVERGNLAIAPDMRAGPRPIIDKCTAKCGVSKQDWVLVWSSLDQAGVPLLSTGEHIATATVIWQLPACARRR